MSNPYHDPKSGEFTSGPGGSAAKPPRGFMRHPRGGFTRDTRSREQSLRGQVTRHKQLAKDATKTIREAEIGSPEISRAKMAWNYHNQQVNRLQDEHDRLLEKRTVGYTSKKYPRDELGGMIGRTRPDE